MTTNLISAETGPRVGYVAVSALPETSVMPLPRVRRQAISDGAWAGLKPIFHKSTGVSVPGCRGAT